MNSLSQLRTGFKSASGPFWRVVGWYRMGQPGDVKTIARNIGRYKRLLTTENDPKRRETIIRRLSEEEANLRRISKFWK
jgi:hypothetical protein